MVSELAFAGGREHVTGTYNVGYGQRMTISESAKRIIVLTGSQSAVEYMPERVGDVGHSLASCQKLQDTGWSPTYDVGSGLRETIAFCEATARQAATPLVAGA